MHSDSGVTMVSGPAGSSADGTAALASSRRVRSDFGRVGALWTRTFDVGLAAKLVGLPASAANSAVAFAIWAEKNTSARLSSRERSD